MRAEAASLSCCATVMAGIVLRPHPEHVADRISELGPVQRVEMELADAAGIELAAQFRRDRGGDQLAGGGQIVEPLEQAVEPGRYGGAAQGGELAGLGDVGDGQYARHQLG